MSQLNGLKKAHEEPNWKKISRDKSLEDLCWTESQKCGDSWRKIKREVLRWGMGDRIINYSMLVWKWSAPTETENGGTWEWGNTVGAWKWLTRIWVIYNMAYGKAWVRQNTWPQTQGNLSKSGVRNVWKWIRKQNHQLGMSTEKILEIWGERKCEIVV